MDNRYLSVGYGSGLFQTTGYAGGQFPAQRDPDLQPCLVVRGVLQRVGQLLDVLGQAFHAEFLGRAQEIVQSHFFKTGLGKNNNTVNNK
jgi:hypothetical protein